MATWRIEQKAEVWYLTEVEAETFEEAIKLSQSSSDWKQEEYDPLFSDHFLGYNFETDEEFESGAEK